MVKSCFVKYRIDVKKSLSQNVWLGKTQQVFDLKMPTKSIQKLKYYTSNTFSLHFIMYFEILYNLNIYF